MSLRRIDGTTDRPTWFVVRQLDSGVRYWVATFGPAFVNTAVQQVTYTTSDPTAWAGEQDKQAAMYPTVRT